MHHERQHDSQHTDEHVATTGWHISRRGQVAPRNGETQIGQMGETSFPRFPDAEKGYRPVDCGESMCGS
jgi:hypothetical protein